MKDCVIDDPILLILRLSFVLAGETADHLPQHKADDRSAAE